MHHAFLYISLPSLHNYDMKLPDFTFCGGREHKTTTSFSFAELRYSLLDLTPEKKLPTFDELNKMI